MGENQAEGGGAPILGKRTLKWLGLETVLEEAEMEPVTANAASL